MVRISIWNSEFRAHKIAGEKIRGFSQATQAFRTWSAKFSDDSSRTMIKMLKFVSLSQINLHSDIYTCLLGSSGLILIQKLDWHGY